MVPMLRISESPGVGIMKESMWTFDVDYVTRDNGSS